MTPEANIFRSEQLTAAPEKLDSNQRPPAAGVTRTGVWLHRVWLVVFVIFCIEVGLLLTVLPWTRVWTDNTLLAIYPAWRAIVENNFVRGLVTGLGLIDVWIGIWEAVHYRDPGKR